MSVDDTLAERGKRYGDFTDHAEICQRIKLAMIAGSARWTRLSDVQKQALEVIADKIARILSGDPNYADNWHDIQGYAKLVEDRLPKPVEAPMTFKERDAEVDAEVKAALTKAGDCPECGYPTDDAGTHYASCSRLTAPEGFVEQVEATFDALETRCPGCGVEPLAVHQPGCPIALESEEPAAAIDDDSTRRQAIDQNGNDGAVYEDPWYGAPEWARFKAQDADGRWWWYDVEPYQLRNLWVSEGDNRETALAQSADPNPNWRDTLIERP
jgi:hypothetical protein